MAETDGPGCNEANVDPSRGQMPDLGHPSDGPNCPPAVDPMVEKFYESAARPLPRMEAIEIPEGSLVVLRDVELDIDTREMFLKVLAEVVGHHRFLILQVYDGSDVEVVGPGNVATFLQSLNLSPNEGDSPDGTEEREL